MNDPRDYKLDDPFNELTSDEEDQSEIQRQLQEIERQKNDLIERLKRKKENAKTTDPNFVTIQSSPIPKKKMANSESQLNVIPMKPLVLEENPNETQLKSEVSQPSYTTSYFMNKFSNSKKEEERNIKEYTEMMSARVHTFAGTGATKKYKPTIVDEVEEFSHLNINKRYISKDELNKAMREVKVLRLSKLFAKVRPPTFTEPKYSNWAVVGIITAKDNVKFTTSAKPTKFMKLTLSDFQYTLDMFIFGNNGVQRYYNLRVGDIIAVLNPDILPWRPSDKGSTKMSIKSFNLRIGHKFNCILEIGSSKDLGWCPILNRSTNKPCGTPVNKSKEARCEYHREIQFRRTNAQRVELSGTYALGAPVKVESRPALYKKETGTNSFKIVSDERYKARLVKDPLDFKRHHFRSTNSAKAFFDEDFQNPEMLSNLDSKRRKLGDIKKDKRLQGELARAFDRGDSQSLIKKTPEEYSEMRKTTEATLQSGLIQRLGFDPTNGKVGTVLKNSTEPNLKNQLQEKKQSAVHDLLSFKKERVNLRPSKFHQIKRKEHREKSWAEHFGKLEEDPMTNSDSNSDLEILP